MDAAFRDPVRRWRISAFATVSWRDGAIHISSAVSGITLAARNIDILNVIHAFAPGKSVPAVLEEFSSFPRAEVRECISELIYAGVLIAEDTSEPEHWEPTALAYHRSTRVASASLAHTPRETLESADEPSFVPL